MYIHIYVYTRIRAGASAARCTVVLLGAWVVVRLAVSIRELNLSVYVCMHVYVCIYI